MTMPRQLSGEPFVCKGCRRAGSPADNRGAGAGEPAEAESIYGEDGGFLGGYAVIALCDFLTWLFSWVYRIVFFWILHTFIPLRKGIPLRILAFFASSMFTGVIVYLNDLPNILLPLFAFFMCVSFIREK